MKSLLALIALICMTGSVFAHNPEAPGMGKKKQAKVLIKGEKAKTIYEALDAEVIVKDRPHFTVDVKKVAKLRCVKRIKKSDTSVEIYRCTMKGKLIKKGRREARREMRRRARRRARRQQQHS